MADVFLKRISLSGLLKSPEVILDLIKEANLSSALREGDFTGIKIHFGEKGNLSFVNPSILGPLVKYLKEKRTKPFIFDTNTLYRGQRMNAVDHLNLARAHGFGKLNIPIIIGDGLKGNDYVEVVINKKHFSSCFLGEVWRDTDFILSVAHLTAHLLTGFGATLKNLGMGIASRKGKMAQHCEVAPYINSKYCKGCGICARMCPQEAIEKEGETYRIIADKCTGCAQCISACPWGAVKINWSIAPSVLQERMVEYAYAATHNKRCAYFNFCVFITKECDCMNKETKGVVDDVGVLFSYDPVAVDRAGVDLVIEGCGLDIFKKLHPDVDYEHQFKYAEEIGLGRCDYRLIEVR